MYREFFVHSRPKGPQLVVVVVYRYPTQTQRTHKLQHCKTATLYHRIQIVVIVLLIVLQVLLLSDRWPGHRRWQLDTRVVMHTCSR